MMKALLLCILLAALLPAHQHNFLLPDRMHDAEAFLRNAIRKAEHKVLIATPNLRDRALSGALADAAEHGIAITLITSAEPADAGALVRYAGVRLLTLEGLRADDFNGRLEVTLLQVDEHIGCLGTLPLTHTELAHSVGILECSDEPAAVHRYAEYLETMIKRSSPYLQP